MPKPKPQAKSGRKAPALSVTSTSPPSAAPALRSWFGPRYQRLAAVALVLLVKSVALIQLNGHILLRPAGSPDSSAYVNLAIAAASGNWSLAPGLYFVSPLYIYFLAAVMAATGSLLAAKAVQIVLGTVAVCFIWLAAREWFGARAAWLSASVATLTGLFTFYEVTLLQASLDVFLTSAFLAALAFGVSRKSAWWTASAGVICGLQALNRPNVLLAILAVLVGLAILRRWRFAIVLAAGLLLGVSPAVARNKVVTGDWSLSTSHGGLNLLIGNAADATGLYRAIPGIRANMAGQAQDTRRVAEASTGRPLTDAEVSAHFTGLAVTWITENPAAWLRLMAIKTYYTFHGQHIALPLSYPFFAYDADTILKYLFLGPSILLPFGCFGLAVCAPRMKLSAYLVWVSFAPAYAVAVALFFVSERYRLPLLVPLAIGTGAAVDRLWCQVRAGKWREITRDGAVIVTLAVLMNWSLGWTDGDGRLEQRIQMAESLAADGDKVAAQHWAARGLPGYPYQAKARRRLASSFAERREWALAIEHLEVARTLEEPDPTLTLELARALRELPNDERAVEVLNALPASTGTDSEVWLALGRLAMSLKIAAKGEEFFARAVRLAPASAAAREQLSLAQLLLGKYQAAAGELTEVVRLDPTNADAWAHLAVAYLELGRPSEALRCVNEALARQPGHQLAQQVKKVIGK